MKIPAEEPTLTDKPDSNPLPPVHIFTADRYSVPDARLAELAPELARLNAADGPMRCAGVSCDDPWRYPVYRRSAAMAGKE